jgi:hypothetical protein
MGENIVDYAFGGGGKLRNETELKKRFEAGTGASFLHGEDRTKTAVAIVTVRKVYESHRGRNVSTHWFLVVLSTGEFDWRCWVREVVSPPGLLDSYV